MQTPAYDVEAELAQHSTDSNAWMACHGLVLNLSKVQIQCQNVGSFICVLFCCTPIIVPFHVELAEEYIVKMGNLSEFSLLGARTPLGAPGLTTRNKKLLGAPGIATRSDRTLLVWPARGCLCFAQSKQEFLEEHPGGPDVVVALAGKEH